jgi:hypothetical protein
MIVQLFFKSPVGFCPRLITNVVETTECPVLASVRRELNKSYSNCAAWHRKRCSYFSFLKVWVERFAFDVETVNIGNKVIFLGTSGVEDIEESWETGAWFYVAFRLGESFALWKLKYVSFIPGDAEAPGRVRLHCRFNENDQTAEMMSLRQLPRFLLKDGREDQKSKPTATDLYLSNSSGTCICVAEPVPWFTRAVVQKKPVASRRAFRVACTEYNSKAAFNTKTKRQ